MTLYAYDPKQKIHPIIMLARTKGKLTANAYTKRGIKRLTFWLKKNGAASNGWVLTRETLKKLDNE